METKDLIYCKRCKKNIVELKPGVPLDPSFLDEFEKEEPKNSICYNCRKKWSEENLKCKKCGSRIDMHQYLLHEKCCDECE